MDKQINHDKFYDESKTRTHRLSKLLDDGDLWAPNSLLTPEQKKNTIWAPADQTTDCLNHDNQAIYIFLLQMHLFLLRLMVNVMTDFDIVNFR